jgi:hypothetical protein
MASWDGLAAIVCVAQVCYHTAQDDSDAPDRLTETMTTRSETILKPRHVTFDELSEGLHTYEQKHGYSTVEFYRRYQRGEPGDEDDLMMWAGLYYLYLTSLPIPPSGRHTQHSPLSPWQPGLA